MTTAAHLTLAVPKGRILDELVPLLEKVGIMPGPIVLPVCSETSRAMAATISMPVRSSAGMSIRALSGDV